MFVKSRADSNPRHPYTILLGERTSFGWGGGYKKKREGREMKATRTTSWKSGRKEERREGVEGSENYTIRE